MIIMNAKTHFGLSRFVVGLVAVLTLALIACGGSDVPAATSESAAGAQQPTDTPPPQATFTPAP